MSMTQAEKQELERLRAENASLKAGQAQSGGYRFTMKVAPKSRAICIWGFGRFPWTVYARAFLAYLDALGVAKDHPARQWVEANKASLSWSKDDKAPERPEAEAVEAEAEPEAMPDLGSLTPQQQEAVRLALYGKK